MKRRYRNLLFFTGALIVGGVIGRLIQPGIIVWEHVQDIQVGDHFELEITTPTEWLPDERWRLYTLDMAIDTKASNRPVISLGHDEDLNLAVFLGPRHNDKAQVIEPFSRSDSRLIYHVPLSLFQARPFRLWLWSGETGYTYRVERVEIKERASWRLTEDNPYFYYTI